MAISNGYVRGVSIKDIEPPVAPIRAAFCELAGECTPDMSDYGGGLK